MSATLACLLSLLVVQLIVAIPAESTEGPPMVASVRPPSGLPAGGSTVTIEGNGFGDATGVRFGDVEASDFRVTANGDDATALGTYVDQITVVSPPHVAGSVHVTVTTPRGTSLTSDCGDSNEVTPNNTAPPCDRFYYFAEPGGGAWTTTGVQKGTGGQATLLLTGKVLVTGASQNDAQAQIPTEIYDPASGSWSSCPEATASSSCPAPLPSSHSGPTATLLKDGRVLVAGGATTRSDLYDPATGKWSRTGDLRIPRFRHGATLLADGRVLVTGGDYHAGYTNPGNSAEIYSPARGEWTDAKPMVEGVTDPAAVRLGSDKVLVAGGRLPSNATQATGTDTSQLYDPVLDVWTSCPLETAATPDCPGPLVHRRFWNSATLLSDGKLLAAGGVTSDGVVTYSSSELYDPKRGIWTETGRLREARFGHVAARLSNGRVLVAGGGGRYGNGGYEPLSSAELYDPATGLWSQAPFMPDANASTGVALPTGPWTACGPNCGKVLVVRAGANVRSLLFTPTPEVAAVMPVSGPASGGTPVTVTGTGLASVNSVKFGGVEAQRIDPDADNPDGKLIAVAPPHAPGTVDVTLTTDGGSSATAPADRFTYVADGGAGSTSAAGALTQGTTVGSKPVGRPPSRGVPSVSERSALKRCLDAVASHARRERRLARRGSARERARARRHLRRHAASGRLRCLTPGRVRDLKASAFSASTIMLTFSTPGSVASSPPPAGRYILKQSPRPITSERDFRRAGTLCGGLCRFKPTRLGQRINLTITGLRPHATYYYAIKAVGASGQAGPRSRTSRATTRLGGGR